MKPKEHTRLLLPLWEAIPSQTGTSALSLSLLSGLFPPGVPRSTFTSSVYPLGTAGRTWELLSGQLQEHRLYSRKRARVCLSSPQDNNSHMENLLWLQLLHSSCACVSSFRLALEGCSNFYHTLKEKATLHLS